jgi:uncharacterized coiled-coil DUF342 family protein
MLKIDKKQAYRDKMEAQIKEWGAKIDILSAKAAKANANARLAAFEGVEELKSKRDLAAAKLKELREASDEAWDEVRAGAENAFTEARVAVEAAIARLKE